MTRARRDGQEYELLNVTDNAEFVLRDAYCDVTLAYGDELGRPVEIQCERCGRWSIHAGEVGFRSRWVCMDRSCYDAEQAENPDYGSNV